ncbi:DUF4258 domain-containing protein [Thalassoglobus sp.]|uniref:DUF4258 domain-containing protein n=1 Tax=Thalassoglobus sp. TaxID=2795869 RepID=UPI003AA82FFC
MPVKFTSHARIQMEARGITVAQVYRLLAYGRFRNQYGSCIWSANLNRIKDEYWRSLLENLRVICTPDLCVVTAFHIEEAPMYNVTW